jgi:SecD/SecF fusion protein
MQNKSAVWLFTILLALATLYILSKGWVADRFETQALEYVTAEYADDIKAENPGISDAELADALDVHKRTYLRDSGFVEVYPIMGYSYKDVKEQELNFGLDLQGGMHVTLEVSIAELVIALSGNSENEDFLSAIRKAQELQRQDNADFITLFEQAWGEQNATVDLWRIFNSPENADKFPAKSTKEQIFSTLREEAQAAINNTEHVIKKRIDQFGVAQPSVQKQSFSGRIMVELPGVDDPERVREKLKATANLEFWPTYTLQEVGSAVRTASIELGRSLNPDVFAELEDTTSTTTPEIDLTDAAADSTSTDTDGLDLSGTGDTASDEDDLTDSEEKERAKKIDPLFSRFTVVNNSGNSPILGYAPQHDTASINSILKDAKFLSGVAEELLFMWSNKGEMLDVNTGGADSDETEKMELYSLYMLKDESKKGLAPLDGSVITDARVGYDVTTPVVDMTMDAEVGTPKWREMTQNAFDNGQRAIAISMDNRCYSAPFVNNGAIEGGRSQITLGQGSTNQLLEEATDLSELLRAGSLPAPAKIVDEYTVGPSLGAENIKSGLMSFVIALMMVLIYMIFYYKGAGLVSNIALIANLFFLIGALASVGAALTLPGIAGIVLTIGMAVDANVLIYERIREEMRLGKGLGAALKDGYSKAYSAIVDANITTLLTAIILFTFGSGPIQGFATTLIIGIFTSLFSAIVITRLIFFNRLEKKKSISFSTAITKNWFTNLNFQFVKKRKMFYVISGLVIVGGAASLFTKGLDYGVDFSGGTRVDVTLTQSVERDDVETALAAAFKTDAEEGSVTVQAIGQGGDRYKIETDFMINSTSEDRDEIFDAALKLGLNSLADSHDINEQIKVDPSMSDDFRRDAAQATIFALIVIFLYIVFRFRKWQFGLGALLAMMHDVLIVLSLFSIFWGILPFGLEINQAFIAAILTVIGYSINDTVVVFDRIREYLAEYKREDQKTVINRALNSTLSRTINTSVSTFVVLLTIFLFGGETIQGFAFALMIGVVVGTYSSIFIATPVVIDLSNTDEVKA